MAELQLMSGLMQLSEEKQIWDIAKLEWKLDYIDEHDEADETCLCGHYPIKQCCYLVNTKNGSHALVGNCCVNRFRPDLGSEKLFAFLTKLQKNPRASAPVAVVEMAFRKYWITQAEYLFYSDNYLKRQLTAKQWQWKEDINKRIKERATYRPKLQKCRADDGHLVFNTIHN